MRRRRDSISWGLALGLLLAAAALHLVFAVTLQGVMKLDWKGRPLPKSDSVMEVSLVPAEEEAEPTDPEEELQQKELERGVIVQNRPPPVEEAPDNTNQISEFDSKVAKETIAPTRKPIPGMPMLPKGDDAQKNNQDDRESDDRENRSEADGEGEAVEGEGDSSADSDISKADDGDVADQAGARKNSAPQGLRGTPDQLQGLFGRPGTYDHLPNVDQGADNILNSKRNKYASFFNRVRDQVSREWEPEVVHSKNDPYGKIYGNKTRTTRLRILLNADGSVHRIYVDQPSGVSYLDEEAIRAVRLGAPFINPPPQLIDPKSGKIDFTFNFILLIDQGMSKRIFRYKR